jgi:hypothetical protein
MEKRTIKLKKTSPKLWFILGGMLVLFDIFLVHLSNAGWIRFSNGLEKSVSVLIFCVVALFVIIGMIKTIKK